MPRVSGLHPRMVGLIQANSNLPETRNWSLFKPGRMPLRPSAIDFILPSSGEQDFQNVVIQIRQLMQFFHSDLLINHVDGGVAGSKLNDFRTS